MKFFNVDNASHYVASKVSMFANAEPTHKFINEQLSKAYKYIDECKYARSVNFDAVSIIDDTKFPVIVTVAKGYDGNGVEVTFRTNH